MAENIIKVNELSKEFPGVLAVDKVSFEVEAGGVFGFVGPNGAGKTTTINMLCTLLKPTQGSATVAGYDVQRQSDKVRSSIGIVFQDTTLDDRLTARENLEFHGVVYHLPKDEREKRIEAVLSLVELKRNRDDIVSTFSGGMKRRLEVARGLLHRPKVLFLDEPTLGLDPQTRSRIWDYLHELKGEEETTIFLTTHYMDEAENCDRLAIIDYGKIIASDAPESLKRTVKKDIIHLKTTDNEKMKDEISRKYQVKVQSFQDGICFEKERAEEFVPQIAADFRPQIKSISVRRPTLDDVFLYLTGREIREEEATPREQMKARGWPGRRRI